MSGYIYEGIYSKINKHVELFANSGDHDQTPHSAASDLGLHRLLVTHLGVSSLKWVNLYKINILPWLLSFSCAYQ